jgi:hypothetical protein
MKISKMLRLKLVHNIDKTTSRNVLCISAPEDGESLAQKTVIVIDYSGSMSSDATPGLPESERDGISILMLIIHCIKVMIGCYSKKDSVSIVCFNENAQLYFPMTKMTDANKNNILSKLESIRAGGSTRIWSGIKMGLNTLKNSFQVNEQCNQTIMVFTDGKDESANKPLRGNIYELDGFIRDNSDWCKTITMNTVGFGSKLDSKELFEMAERLNGTFSHIPESSTAGTIMINRLATDLTSYGNNIRVIATMKDGSVSTTNIGSICVGQNRTHPICHSLDDTQKIEVSMFNGLSHVVTQVDLTTVTEDKKTVLECWAKLDLIKTIEHNIDKIQTTSPTVSLPYCTVQFANFRTRNEMNNSYPYIQGCLKDVDDQLRKAVEKEKWCAAWGLHYLRSYLHTTRREIVNNFRDYAIQHFASDKFTDLQTHCEKIFLATPPIPKKTPIARTNTYTSTPRLNPTIDTSTSSSNSSFETRYFGSCFHPESSIMMADGSVKPVGQVRKGDIVSCGNDRVASVRCVTFSSGLFEMINIDGFSLTSTHPVRSLNPEEDKWVRPKDISSNRYEYDKVVNFLLDAHHEIVGVRSGGILSPIRCCTLAHGLKGDVIEHDYLGTDKVARDLEEIEGFDSGIIYVCFTRENEYISGIQLMR